MEDKYKEVSRIRIKNRRLELKLTLEDVGEICGVGKSTVRKWETGQIDNMKRDKIYLLSKALKVSPTWLMGYDVSMESDSVENDVQLVQLKEELKEAQFAFYDDIKDLSVEDLEDVKKFIDYVKSRKK